MRHFSLFAVLLLVPIAVAAGEVEFAGAPLVRVDVLDGVSQTQPVPRQRRSEFAVRVERAGTGYVWASRKGVPMLKVESGVYVTYIATTGAGYVRVLNPEMRKAVQSMPPEQREKEYVYMEHMINQLGSITYFGR